jgi:hypothetical protein
VVFNPKFIQGHSRGQHHTGSNNNSYRPDHYKSSPGLKLNYTPGSNINNSNSQELISNHHTQNPVSRLAGIRDLVKTTDKRPMEMPRKTPGGSLGALKTDFQKFCMRNENHPYGLFKKNRNNTCKEVDSDSLVNIDPGITGLNRDICVSLASGHKIPMGHFRSNCNSAARFLDKIKPPESKIKADHTPNTTQSPIKAIEGKESDSHIANELKLREPFHLLGRFGSKSTSQTETQSPKKYPFMNIITKNRPKGKSTPE